MTQGRTNRPTAAGSGVRAVESAPRVCHCHWRTPLRERGHKVAPRTAWSRLSVQQAWCKRDEPSKGGSRRAATPPPGWQVPQSRNIPFSQHYAGPCSRPFFLCFLSRVVYQRKQRGSKPSPYWMPRVTVPQEGMRQKKRKCFLRNSDKGARFVLPGIHHSKWDPALLISGLPSSINRRSPEDALPILGIMARIIRRESAFPRGGPEN